MVTDSADRRMENINKYTEFQMSRWTWTCDLHMLDARLTLVLVWCIQSYNLLQMMSTALEWCIVTVLCSFHACIQKYRNVGPISSVNETRKKCRLFVASSFSNTLTEQKKNRKHSAPKNILIAHSALWACDYVATGSKIVFCVLTHATSFVCDDYKSFTCSISCIRALFTLYVICTRKQFPFTSRERPNYETKISNIGNI